MKYTLSYCHLLGRGMDRCRFGTSYSWAWFQTPYKVDQKNNKLISTPYIILFQSLLSRSLDEGASSRRKKYYKTVGELQEHEGEVNHGGDFGGTREWEEVSLHTLWPTTTFLPSRNAHCRLFSLSWSYYYRPSILVIFYARPIKNKNDLSGLGAYSREYRNRRSRPLHPEVLELWPIGDRVNETQTGEIKSCFWSQRRMGFVVSTEALLWTMGFM